MNKYTDTLKGVLPYDVTLAHPIGESMDQHVAKAHEAALWLRDGARIRDSLWDIDMRGGNEPTTFSFKRHSDALMFKMVWG